jgi:exodeoxyribonuclease VII large subunit
LDAPPAAIIGRLRSMKIEPLDYGDRRVFSVSGLNKGIATWLQRLPELWVEGEVTELRRRPSWASVFFTLKDPETGASVPASIARRRFDRLELDLAEGERVHVLGRAQLFEERGALAFRATTIERFGLGAHLAAIERLKRALAAEGLFAPERKRTLPRFPRAVGVLTGVEAAARGDIVTAITTRFPPARIILSETRVQGRGAPKAIVAALAALAAHSDVDVIIVARGGGSFEDLLPFSDEAVVRAIAACRVPVVSAIGHEQDAPLSDLAADVRASTPTAAARLVVPDLDELIAGLERARTGLERSVRRRHEVDAAHLTRLHDRLRAGPALLLERRAAAIELAGGRLRALSPSATVARGYAIVRVGTSVVRDAAAISVGDRIDVELAAGALAASVDEVRT